ncbi:MAG: TolC family protein [Gemmatimonadales bacterium]
MNIRQVALATVALAWAGGAPARAQDWAAAVAGDSTLQALVAEALQRNPALLGRQAAFEAAERRVRPAGALPDPLFQVGRFDLFRQHYQFTRIEMELSQEVPWPGTLGARTGVARAAAARARAEEAASRRDVTVAVAAAYYRLRYLVTALGTAASQQRLLEAAVELTTTRYATGTASQSDPLQAKLARDRLASEQLALQAEYAAVVAALNALRGRYATDSIAIAPLEAPAVRARLVSPPSPDSLVALALAAHPLIAARRAAAEQAGSAVRVERLAGRPDLTFTLGYEYNSTVVGFNIPDVVSAFLGVRLPIWAGRKQHRLADAARADSVAAAAALRETEVQLTREVVETAARTAAGERRLLLLVDGVVPAARGTVQSVLRTYQVGRTEFLTFLAVQDALFRAELEAAAVAAEHQTHVTMLRELTAGERSP